MKILNDANNIVAANVKIERPLEYLSNSWETLEISLINCEINFPRKLSYLRSR